MRQAVRRSVYPSRYCLDGFGFARRFSRELIGVTDGVVFDLTRLFDYTVTFLLCVLLHRIGRAFACWAMASAFLSASALMALA